MNKSHSLFYHHLRSAFLALLVVMLLVGGIIYLLAVNSLEQTAKESLLYNADFRKERILTYFQQQREWINRITENEAIRDSVERIIDDYRGNRQTVSSTDHQQHFRTLFSSHEIEDLFLVTTDGELAFSIRPMEGEIGVNLTPEGFYGETIFSRLLQKISDQPGTHLSSYGRIDQLEEATLLIGAPVFSTRNSEKMTAILVRPVSLTWIRELLENYTGLGESGEIIVTEVSQAGRSENIRYISHFRSDNQLPDQSCIALRRANPNLFPMYRALSGKNGEGWALSYSCRRTFAVWRWLPELNWGLVLRQDRDEILEPIHKLQSELLLFTPLAILFLYWMVYRIAYKVTEPMTRLTRETEQGDIRQFEPGTVSEVNKLAAALQKYEQQLMEEKQNAVDANRTKDDFLATMSHELRTPLAVIIGNCELLKSNADIDQQVLQQLSTMENAAQHQLALVGDILDLKKVESDQLDIDEHPFSVCEMIREIEQMFSTEAESTNLRWSVNCPATSGLIIGDEQRIKRILLNLVDNAFKFTHQGWITLMVELETGVLHFTVTDSGIGMSEDIQGRLFERFKQADSTLSRRFGGVGLGLYISNHLARSMDGSISVSSKEGIGSSFELILPYKVAHQEVPSTEDDSGKEIQTSTLNGSVLVVEDTHTIQQLVKRILEKMGVEVTLAGNGQEAVDLVAARRFDLVLMDLQMPVMDGITASKQIRASGNQVPIVALTANVMQKHRDAFEEADCNGFLEKPINKEALREELERYLHSG